ncbi:peptidoglycan-associated lipoprotein Pal [Candidatus Electronema sp. JC]|uniref:peptidoglycan-associated lipoprotein Pal n=1 Tax=Candidatus Electronema sp. JC TaxID=3401570 RepID=UPI003AA7C379
MNTHASRMALCACMIFALTLTACGPKPVEPYPKQKAGGSTFYDADSGLTTDDAAAEPSYGVDAGENYSALDNLPSAPGSAADIYNSPEAAPVVEALSAGGGPAEKAPGFTADKSAAYKRKNGRSSPELKSIYYNFDQSSVRTDQVAKMEANAQYMKKHAQARVVIEGNCDERGTSEYNLALGERRAVSAKKYLLNLGVAASRIRTMSFGEERPLFVGSEESDYEMNRRSDFVLE